MATFPHSKKIKRALPQLIGVIHLPALAGSPESSDLHPHLALKRAGQWAVKEALLFQKLGFEGIIIENFGDAPFYKTSVPAETISSMSIITAAVQDSVKISVGVNVLRNDSFSALSIAAVTGADFIRVNVLSGVVATDQGLIEGNAAALMRERIRLNATNVAVMADVHVKHAQNLSSPDLEICIEEMAGRGGADAVIVTGQTTGRSPDISHIKQATIASKHCGVPLYIGSGLSSEFLKNTHGFQGKVRAIVGSTLRVKGQAGAPLDLKRMKMFVKDWKTFQQRA